MRLGEQKKLALACVQNAHRAVSMPDIRRAHPGVRYQAIAHLLKTGQIRLVFRGWYEAPSLPPLIDPAEVAVAAIRAAGRPLVMGDLAAYRLRPEMVASLVEQGVLKAYASNGQLDNHSRYYVAADGKPPCRDFIRPRKHSMNSEAVRMLQASATVALDEFVARGITSDALMTLVSRGRIRRVGKDVYTLVEQSRPPMKSDKVIQGLEEIGRPLARQEIVRRWGISGTWLNHMLAQGRLVRLDKGIYGLPGQTLDQYVNERPEGVTEKILRLLREAKAPLTSKQLQEQGIDVYTPVKLAAQGRIRRVRYGVYWSVESGIKMAA